ncbi:MAG: ComEC/Rec2 family competence protein [Patescibacteria group bacterium]
MGESLNQIISSKSKTFLAFCFCFIFGVGLASAAELGRQSASTLYIVILVGVFLAIILWPGKTKRFFVLCCLLFIIGPYRFALAEPVKDASLGQNKNFTATIVAEPAINFAETNYVVQSPEIQSKIYLTLPNYPEYHYGETLSINCFLDEPKNSPGRDFQFAKYMAMKGVGAICSNPSVARAASVKMSLKISFFKQIFLLKSGVSKLVAQLWPEPNSSLLGGLLYGDRNGLSEELKNNFNRVGLSHIVAVSGYNITIIAAAVMSVLIIIGLYRRQAFWLALAIIILFVIFTGASASAVRAGVMGSVFLVGQYLGRPSRAAPSLVLAAALMIIFNPYILFYDAGFQLSALATAGMIFLAEDGVVKTTVAAIVATLPLILYQFGRLSIVALPINILILWIIPFVMLAGFLSLVCAAVFYPLGQVLAYVTGFGLKYIIIFANYFGGQPWASVEMKVSLPVMVLMYVGIIYYVVRKNNYVQAKNNELNSRL